MLREEGAHLESHGADVGEGNVGTGIEIDAELVGVVQVGRADRVRMQLEAAEVGDPGEARGVVDDELLGLATGGEVQGRRAQPLGPRRRRALLIEGLARRSVDEALQHDGPVADAAERAVGDGQVVVDQIALGDAGEVRLVRIGDAHLPPVHRAQLAVVGFCHAENPTPVRGWV